MPTYDGPGVYQISRHIEGYSTIIVEADSRIEAEDIAFESPVSLSDFNNLDIDIDSVRCIEKKSIINEAKLLKNRDLLTGIEEAAWMFTGEIPKEALDRLAQESYRKSDM